MSYPVINLGAIGGLELHFDDLDARIKTIVTHGNCAMLTGMYLTSMLSIILKDLPRTGLPNIGFQE